MGSLQAVFACLSRDMVFHIDPWGFLSMLGLPDTGLGWNENLFGFPTVTSIEATRGLESIESMNFPETGGNREERGRERGRGKKKRGRGKGEREREREGERQGGGGGKERKGERKGGRGGGGKGKRGREVGRKK